MIRTSQAKIFGKTDRRKRECKDSEIGQALHTGVQKAGHETEWTG